MDSLMHLSVAILALIASIFLFHSVGELCSVTDVVLVSSDSGDLSAGQVWAHIDIDGDLVSIVILWNLAGKGIGSAT